MNYYRSFIQNFADIAAPLSALRQTSATFQWSKQCEHSFQTLKQRVIEATSLAHYDPEQPLILATDASPVGLGAVLSQRKGDIERPIAYASKTLDSTQKKYSQIDKEALAIIYGVDKFHQFLYGRKFEMITDHKPLIAIFSPSKSLSACTSQRLNRYAIKLMAYNFDIRYKPTKLHGNADGLSRLPVGNDPEFDSKEGEDRDEINQVIQQDLDCVPQPINTFNVAKAIKNDRVLLQVLRYVQEDSWPVNSTDLPPELRPYWNQRKSLILYKNCVLLQREGTVRIVVPKKYRAKVLQQLHVAHSGMSRMKSMARRHVWWPSIGDDIEDITRNCQTCGENAHDPPSTTTTWRQPERPWERVHIDFAGPFMGKMWLICVDAKSKFPYVSHMDIGNTTTASTIRALHQVFAIEGLAEVIVSDNGPQFSSKEFAQFCLAHGITHVTTAPYHPASNGEAERFVQTFKSGMKKMEADNRDLHGNLSKLLANYRATPHPALDGTSPAEVLHGRQQRCLLDWKQTPSSSSVCRELKRFFKPEDTVYVRVFRGERRWLEGTVIRRIGAVLYYVRTSEGTLKRHINQIRRRTILPLKSNSPTVAPLQQQQQQDELRVAQPQQQQPQNSQASSFTPSNYITRYGRVIVKPNRFSPR